MQKAIVAVVIAALAVEGYLLIKDWRAHVSEKAKAEESASLLGCTPNGMSLTDANGKVYKMNFCFFKDGQVKWQVGDTVSSNIAPSPVPKDNNK